MVTYLIRCAETGREQQARHGKLRRDLARVIEERLPGARIESAPGRLLVESPADTGASGRLLVETPADAGVPGRLPVGTPADAGLLVESPADACAVLAALPGVGSVSPCRRVAFGDLEAAVVELVRARHASSTFAVRIRRGGSQAGASDLERRPELARRLADAITAATDARVDLTRPEVEIGIELRGDEAFIFDCVIHGVDRTGPMVPRASGEPRFVADQMLGRLAARLRLLGYDTMTVFDIADSEVTRLAAADGRILLTRDGPLARTRAVPVHRVRATAAREQLAEVLDAFAMSPDPARYFSRCTLCNTPVEPVAEAVVRDRLPPSVRDQKRPLFRCPGCNQLYWRGSHVDRILAELAT